MISARNPCGDGECRNVSTNKCKNIDITQYKSETSELPDQCKTLSIFNETDDASMKVKLNETLDLLLDLKAGNFIFGKNPKQFLVFLSDIENIIKKEHLEHECYEKLEKIRKKYDEIIQKSNKKIPDMSPVKPWTIKDLDKIVINDNLPGESILKEHQKRPAAYLLENDRLLAVHGTGTGKTLAAIFAAEIFIKNNKIDNVSSPVVIFTAPPGLVKNIKNNLEKYLITSENYQTLSYNEVIALQKSGQYDGSNTLLIIDEVHNLRNAKSITSTYMRAAAYNSKKVLMLTATPFVNNFNDFVPIINMLYCGDLLSNQQDFTKSWKVDSPEFSENIKRLADYLEHRIDYFPTDYNDENFPKIIKENCIIKMQPQYLEPYKQLLDGKAIELTDIYNILNPGASDNDTVEQSFKIIYENPDAFYNGCRRLVNTLYKDPQTLSVQNFLNVYISEKITAALDIIGDKKTIIYTNWLKQGIKPIKKILDKKGYSGKYKIYTGALKAEERDDIVKKYNDINESSAQILIMSAAGSEGIDLKCTSNVIIIDPPWNQANLQQIIGRAARFRSHSDEQCKDDEVRVYYMILTTPGDHPDNTDDTTHQVKLGDILLYNIIKEKNKTTIELNKEFAEISINNMLVDNEESVISPSEEPAKNSTKEEQPIIPIKSELTGKEEISEAKIAAEETLTEEDYVQMFKKFINNEDRDRLKNTTPRELKDKVRECYTGGKKSRTFNRAYNSNKEEILQCVKAKLYPELS